MSLFWLIVWSIVVAFIIIGVITWILGLLAWHSVSGRVQPYAAQAKALFNPGAAASS